MMRLKMEKQVEQSSDNRCVLWRIARVLVFESSFKRHTFLSLMLFCSISAHFSEIQLVCDRPTDGRTDRRTDGPTDRRTDGHTLLQRCENASKKRCTFQNEIAGLFFKLSFHNEGSRTLEWKPEDLGMTLKRVQILARIFVKKTFFSFSNLSSFLSSPLLFFPFFMQPQLCKYHFKDLALLEFGAKRSCT